MQRILFATLVLLATHANGQPKIGTPAPEITLNDLNGSPVSLSSLKGKVVLIDFWASWCGPCRKANPGLVKMYARLKQKGFEIYGISLDDEKQPWKHAIDQDGITWIQVN